MLSTAVVASSLLGILHFLLPTGILQQRTYSRHILCPHRSRFGSNHWREAIFYTHALSLPCFLPFFPQIIDSASEFDLHLCLLLLLNVSTQSNADPPLIIGVCIIGVYGVSSTSSAVTLNLILAVRKFVSLVISVWYFGNDFGLGHAVGTGMVFSGTMVY